MNAWNESLWKRYFVPQIIVDTSLPRCPAAAARHTGAERSLQPPTAPPRRAAAAHPSLHPSTAAPRDTATTRPRPSRATSHGRGMLCLSLLILLFFCKQYGHLDPVYIQLNVDSVICSANYIVFLRICLPTITYGFAIPCLPAIVLCYGIYHVVNNKLITIRLVS
jgi:hypothetical protein